VDEPPDTVLLRVIEQGEGAEDVRPHKGGAVGDRAVDVALRGEVDDGIDRVVPEDGRYRAGVADVALDEGVVRIIGDIPEALRVPRVG